MDLLDRLSDKFTVGDGCWEWQAAHHVKGYGQIRIDGRIVPAHRVLYGLMVGPIPEGLQLDHLCRNPRCVRPSHLEPVTNAENGRRGVASAVNAARQRAKTHCPAGHEYAGENLAVRPNGDRWCRACARLRDRRRRAMQRPPLNPGGGDQGATAASPMVHDVLRGGSL